MHYKYKTERPWLFTEEGQVKFLLVRDTANRLCRESGAVRSDKLLGEGSTWQSMACIDRLIELKEFVELTPPTVVGQRRVIVKATEE